MDQKIREVSSNKIVVVTFKKGLKIDKTTVEILFYILFLTPS